ncbi:MAG: peptidoglycan hydrolase-like protein with peptidoglycan-binding domain [Granulosicoccus sp.]|jgi:peptidoglycan hydrolase-like protein with peptidoglycan-binding domain
MSVNKRGYPLAATEDVMMIQETMQNMGLYEGVVDGLAGSKTYIAVRAYKKSIHMAPNNSLTEEFIKHLRTEA